MLRPLHHFLVIEVEVTEKMTKGGILLANTKPLPTAKVLAVSDLVTEVKPGERILLNVYSPLDITDSSGDSYTVVSLEDVYGVID